MIARRLLLTVFLFASSSCGWEDVVQGVSQKQSVEIMVALERAQIEVRRDQDGRSDEYRILVAESDRGRALEVLHEFGLPREQERGLEELTRQRGFVPNSQAMNQLRLDLALARQVEELMLALPGVVDVGVVVRSHLGSPKASVVIRYVSHSGRVPFSREEIVDLVVNSVPDIAQKDIQLTLNRVYLPAATATDQEGTVVPLSRLSPFMFQVPERERSVARKQIGVVLFAAVCCALFVGLFTGVKLHRKPRKNPPSDGDQNFFLENEPKNRIQGR